MENGFSLNKTPKEILQERSFGETYFRSIYSSITIRRYKNEWKEFLRDWFKGLNIVPYEVSLIYRNDTNKYSVKCGSSLEVWRANGWINKQDPYEVIW